VRNTSSSSSSPSSSLPHPPTRAVPLYPRISSSAVPTASSIRPVVPTVRPTSRQLSGVTSSSSADGPLWPAVVRHKGLQCQQCIADCQFDPASSADSQTEQSQWYDVPSASSVDSPLGPAFVRHKGCLVPRRAPCNRILALPVVQCRLPVSSGQQCRQSARGGLSRVTRRQPSLQPACGGFCVPQTFAVPAARCRPSLCIAPDYRI